MKRICSMIAGAALCGMCSIAAAQITKDAMCEVIGRFAEGIAIGEKRSLELEVKFDDGSFGSKTCKPSPRDEKGVAICRWMLVNTSTEFMGHNISRVVACVTNSPQLIRKDVNVNSLAGDFTVYGHGADTQVEYQFNSRYDKRHFVAIRITGAEPEED